MNTTYTVKHIQKGLTLLTRWVPVYWLGFEKGVPILAGELFVIALLCQMDKRKK